MLTTLHSVSLFSGIGLLDLGLHRAPTALGLLVGAVADFLGGEPS